MPDELPAGIRFPHLQIVYRGSSPAKFPPAHVKDTQATKNKENRVSHSADLTKSLLQLESDYQKRIADRKKDDLPTIESGVPFVVEVTPGFKLDDLVLQ